MTLQRVVLVVNRLSLGGSEKQVVLLASGLQQRGIRVAVTPILDGGERENDLRQAGIEVFALGFRSLDLDPRDVPTAVRAFSRYVRWLRRERPQVVHAFLYQSYVLAPLAARLAGVPVVIAGRRSLGVYKEGRRTALAVERVATAMTDLVVANSNAVAREVVRQERLGRSKLVVVHNGLPSEAFLPAKPAHLSADAPVVLCVANLIPYKGHGDLLQAVDALHRTGLRFTLLLVGDGPARKSLERQAAGIAADIRFLGARTDVASLYASSDIVVLASLHEGMSNAVLEAMAAGKPVVATDVGGNREAIGDTGVLVPPSSPEAMADALERLLRDPAHRAGLGRLAQERALSLFSADGMVERHVELYESLLRSRCAGSPAT